MDNKTDIEVLAEFHGMPRAAERTRYHCDWDWLMPVWYKFKALKFGPAEFTDQIQELVDKIAFAILHSGPSPSEACKLLAEGIRWYNSTTQNKEELVDPKMIEHGNS